MTDVSIEATGVGEESLFLRELKEDGDERNLFVFG